MVLADWNENAVRSATEELAAQDHKALSIHCDVADDAQVEAMVEQTVATFGVFFTRQHRPSLLISPGVLSHYSQVNGNLDYCATALPFRIRAAV